MATSRTAIIIPSSRRRLRDAITSSLYSLSSVFLILLFLCPLLPAEGDVSTTSLARQEEWTHSKLLLQESPVFSMDNNDMAASFGTGRRYRDVLSITRSLPVKTDIAPGAPVDDQAIQFIPKRVFLGQLETCIHERYYVGVENRGRVSVTLDRADFTMEGFSLATDIRGIRLDPGDRFHVQIVFLPRQVERDGMDAYLRLLTSSGLFSLPIRIAKVVVNPYDVSMIRGSILAGETLEHLVRLKNPMNATIRITEIYARDSFVNLHLVNDSDRTFGLRSLQKRGKKTAYIDNKVAGQDAKTLENYKRVDRGEWDVPAETTSPLIIVAVKLDTPGVHLSYVHIVANDRRLLSVPVCITVLKPGIHMEPEEVDLGVLTDLHQGRELFFSLYNAGLIPLEIVEVKVLKSKLIVAAQLRGSAVIPPQTRAHHALAVQLRVNRDINGGSCVAAVLLKTNASSPELRQQKLRLYGQVVKGHLAFQLNETLVGVVVPLKRELIDHASVIEEKGSERIANVQERSSANFVSIINENNSIALLAGTSQVRTIRLWNRFDCPVELQRVWMDDVMLENGDIQEVIVQNFEQGVVSIGASLPTISFQITLSFEIQGKLSKPRSYSLMVETNATLHRIPIYVYFGFLTLNSTRGLQNYCVFGNSNNLQREEESMRSCLLVPKDSIVAAVDGGRVLADTSAVPVCRSLLFDFDKVASHEARVEMVEAVNENPVPQTLSITEVCKNASVDVSIAAEISEAKLFSYFPYRTGATGAGDRWNDSSHVIFAGTSFVLQPGYRVVFRIKVKAKDVFGEVTVPVMSIRTQSEVLHLYARFVSVQGIIEPVTSTVILPATFPGRMERVHLQYRNTFDHIVTDLVATVSNPKLYVVSITESMMPRQVESVMDLIFSPWEGIGCVGALFLTECWLSYSDPTEEQKCYLLSDYGEFVDKQDLEALRRRDKYWAERATTSTYSTMEAQVRLQTDIMEDVAEVTVKAFLKRPMVTAPAEMTLSPNNGSQKILGHIEFALTEVFELSHIFVHVRNPSNFSISMELTVAEADRHLFYRCEEEFMHEVMDTKSDVKSGDPDHITELCLVEWKTAVANGAQQRSQQEVDLPSFYYEEKVIEVSAGKEAQLGPIFYLPSKVQEVSTRVFVRNELTHIEPVSLLARSGKGTLDISVDASTDYKSVPSYYTAREFAAVNKDEKATQQNGPAEFDGTLSFALTTHDALTDFTQVADLVLSNTGPFALTILNVRAEQDGHDLWTQLTWISGSSPKNDFVVTSGARDDFKVVLAPGEATTVRVSFHASCFAVDLTRWLSIDTSDTVSRVRLEGTIAADAAFTCWHSRMSPSMRFAFLALWLLAVVIAIIAICYSIFLLTRDAWTSEDEKQSVQFDVYVDKSNTKVIKVSARGNHEESSATALGNESSPIPQHTLASINRKLADMEQASSAPAARVVLPAVAELLERRRKEMQTTLRNQSTQNDRLGKNDEVKKNSLNGKTTTKANASNSKTVSPTCDRISASDAASTPVMAKSQSVEHEVVKKAGKTDGVLPVKNATQSATASGRDFFKYNSEKSDHSSKEKLPKGLLNMASFSHKATVQTDVRGSSRIVKPMKLSVNVSGSPYDRSVRSGPVTTSPPKEKETPFEAFRSLSARWRAENEKDNLKNDSPPAFSGKFSGLQEWGNDALSFKSLVHDFVSPRARENRCDEPDNFIRTGARGYLDGFSAPSIPLPVKAPPTTPTTKASPTTAKAPPGFSPADARPFETRAAFDRLQTSGEPASSVSTASSGFGTSSLFANRSPLFGPPLPPNGDITLGSAGRIGSGRSKLLRSLDIQQDSTK
ncbi:unnamed protein product [Peronospora belbahrii]|uniref:Transmembrane protein n=1 Tax=Peronospora belbahrii TaxID=622444 RepID=A0AAU9KNN3_9STRA|nr:unnamed protein product [Peronospora belbahrii]